MEWTIVKNFNSDGNVTDRMQLLRIGLGLSNMVYLTQRLQYSLSISLEGFERILTIDMLHLSLRSLHWPIKCLNKDENTY